MVLSASLAKLYVLRLIKKQLEVFWERLEVVIRGTVGSDFLSRTIDNIETVVSVPVLV